MTRLRELFAVMEEIAPPRYAADWDAVGLQVGAPGERARGILVALDPTLDAVEAAARQGLNLLITHHPLLLSGIKTIDLDSPPGRIIGAAVQKQVAIFSAHTNLDSAEGGINDMLADLLKLGERSPLEPVPGPERTTAGLGRMGHLPEATPPSLLAAHLKERLGISAVRSVGERERPVRRIALCGGSGGSLIAAAAARGAELFITGDIRYHQAREAEELGLPLLDIGHFSSEKIMIGGLTELLRKGLEEKGITLPVVPFEGEREPFALL